MKLGVIAISIGALSVALVNGGTLAVSQPVATKHPIEVQTLAGSAETASKRFLEGLGSAIGSYESCPSYTRTSTRLTGDGHIALHSAVVRYEAAEEGTSQQSHRSASTGSPYAPQRFPTASGEDTPCPTNAIRHVEFGNLIKLRCD